ncbi:hypothetical protein EX895_003999 [Sporisorium graminicola]|uniref:Uncharacterized protein n=1 Tax=Sporisorium graminicola TaxID=280036 RepID=A0A4U7KWK7_9BASI|nr:hypothetical protein EX895_003999 [Sporisorium graminicola]TKY87322.1 hypothetical protein EX895_003999 [Sporisorium graminicola]
MLQPVSRRVSTARPQRPYSTAAQSPRPRQPPKSQGLNQPKAIFWGWAVLVVIAGFSYFTVKSNNTAKKREFMIKQGQELQRQKNEAGEDGQAVASSTPLLMSTTNQEKYAQSPLQSLAAALSRQTTQRTRNPEASRSSTRANE